MNIARPPIVIPDNYSYTTTDNPTSRTTTVQITGTVLPSFVLFSGLDYDSADGYTREQIRQAVAAKLATMQA